MSIENSARDRIASFLPAALAAAMRSYQHFSEAEISEGPKEFTAHHTACKVAIAHIDLLIKLARWADLPATESGAKADPALSAMMRAAQAELDRYHAAQGEDESDERSD